MNLQQGQCRKELVDIFQITISIETTKYLRRVLTFSSIEYDA